ncbi:MAG: DUF192 domain-containing protein [Patescibacteria group bacterium]
MNKNIKTAFLVIFLLIGGLYVIKYTSLEKQLESSLSTQTDVANAKSLWIGGVQVTVEVVDTPEKMSKGLSGRKSLEEGRGMLFVYPDPQPVTFWMPDMNFPIDIIFIRNNTIIKMYENVPNPPVDTPRSELPLYPSGETIDMVLEVPAGWAAKNFIKTGTSISFKQ